MGIISSARQAAADIRAARAWRPGAVRALSADFVFRERNTLTGFTEHEHIEAAASWLARAQDAQRDGGVSGRYFIGSGWSSSYPETTGYIVPTMLVLEAEAGIPGFRDRARRCVEFLLDVQLPSGAFPGMEIAHNRERPSIFNSAQILNGLSAWHAATGDETTLAAARRVADWLIDEQDPDGAWRRHLYGHKTYTYMAHAACWLAEFGERVGDARYLDAARRHLEWVLTHVDDSTGWIRDCGFDDGFAETSAVTHTIAYTLWGVLMMSRILGHEHGFAVASRAAYAVARRLELSKRLPARLNDRWKGTTSYSCLTGNAQMALVWLELHRLESDPTLVSVACKAIDLVKRAQRMHATDDGVRGGIPGSDPIWGDYIKLALPNWAAKFFIDALLAKRRALQDLAPLPRESTRAPARIVKGVPRALPRARVHVATTAPAARPQVVLLADEHSQKVEQFLTAWSAWGFQPDAVVIRHVPEPSRRTRLWVFVKEFGVRNLGRRIRGAAPRGQSAHEGSTTPTSGAPVAAVCARRGIPTVAVTSIDDPTDRERVRALNADLFVLAGYGILRQNLLELARLGTVNAHMGLLPQMRGVKVTEWSRFLGVPIGCTIHLIDAGIDTGDILLFENVDASGADTIAELRRRVDVAQVKALGQVVRWIAEHGTLPPRYSQRDDEGRQYFEMHADLSAVLESELQSEAAEAREAAD
jgi:folate-dependent phosphoribosylglycinamide formyltransferase PurN